MEEAARELAKVSVVFRDDDAPFYIMTFGLNPSFADMLTTDFKLEDIPCVLLALEARTMPHHSFTPEQIRVLGDYFDRVDAEDFVFYVSHRIRTDGDDWNPLMDEEIMSPVEDGLS